ncbi:MULTISPECIES: hypothetical protein [unclassified Sulfitobacter]|nr:MULTISPECIES: hypothetical protein [unclassified Sulfitobacter]
MTTLHTFRRILRQADTTLLQDALGGAALVVMLFIGLHLPAIV